jgi:hypothetical protein
MKMLPNPMPAMLWAGFLLNILPLCLCLLGVISIDQATFWTDMLWMPSIVMMLASFDFPMITMLLILKAMAMGAGQKFYPFYIGVNMPMVQVVALLILAASASVVSYIQRHALRQYTAP